MTKKRKAEMAQYLLVLISTPNGRRELKKAVVLCLVRRRKAGKKTGLKKAAHGLGKYAEKLCLSVLRAAKKQAVKYK